MGHPAAEFSAEKSSTASREPHPESETQTLSHHSDRELEALTLEQHSEDLPKPKKPRSFKLAFVGIAVTVFIFHLDTTALGVALPVSSLPCSDQNNPKHQTRLY